MIRSRRSSSSKTEISYIPHSIGPYLLDKEIGHGSFSVVYRAFLKKSNNKHKNALLNEEECNTAKNNQKPDILSLNCKEDQMLEQISPKTKKNIEKTLINSISRSKSFSTIKKNQIPKCFNADCSDDSKKIDSDQNCVNDDNILPEGKMKLQKHQFYAIKIYPKTNLESQTDEELFQREINAMAFFHHKNIISLKDILSDDYNFYLVMDYCKTLDLKQYITQNAPEGIDEKTASIIFKQIVSAVSYCHSLGVAHRDLKPENILITSFPEIKISDFGLCGYINENQLMRTFCGSPCYSAPECLSKIEYDGRRADTWSLGVILYTMVTGSLPWPLNNSSIMIKNIIKGQYTVPKSVSPSCKSLITGMMKINPKERLTMEQIHNHPWLNQNDQNINDNHSTKVKSRENSDDSDNSESSDAFIDKVKEFSLSSSKSMTLAEFSEVSRKKNNYADHGIYYPFTFVTEKNINSSSLYDDDNENSIINDDENEIIHNDQNNDKHDSIKEDTDLDDSSNNNLSFPVIKKQRKKPRRSDISSNITFLKNDLNNSVSISKKDFDSVLAEEKKEVLDEDKIKQPSSVPLCKGNSSGFTKANHNTKRHQSHKILRFPKKSKSHLNIHKKDESPIQKLTKF